MSLYIPGCDLPKKKQKNLVVFPNGVVKEVAYGIPCYEAIELPPHGRLIDADALMQKYERLIKQGDISPRSGAYVKVFLADAPTIIEAEENKSLKDRLAECDASDLFPELTEEEKAENKRLAKDFKGAEGSGT